MKYRLPGIYLGNISLDLFMEYMSNEDLSDQTLSNDYYKTFDRTENIRVFKVEFTYNSTDYNFYTYNILDDVSIREMIRSYFTDIISHDTPSDYDTNVDNITINTSSGVSISTNLILYDTLVEPSIYGSHLVDNSGVNKYMISVKGTSDGGTTWDVDLDSYTDVLSYIDTYSAPYKIKIYDLRYAAQTEIYTDTITLNIDTTTLNEDSVILSEDVYEGQDIVSTNDYIFYFGKKSLMNYIGTNSNGESVFFFRDKFGSLTNSPYKNVMMMDIQNNRDLYNKSIQSKMLTKESYYSGIAGLIRHQDPENDKNEYSFSKFDKYNINKTFEKISSIPVEATDIRFEDMEPNMIDLVDNAPGNIYTYTDNNMVVYTDIINTANLPKFKAIYKTDTGVDQYYIFDTIRGNVPEYRTVGTSDNKTLCLLDVYDKLSISVDTLNGETTSHSLKYNLSPGGDDIFRTIEVNGKTYYVKLADSENELTAYIIVTTNDTIDFDSVTDSTASEILADFAFSDLGLNVVETDLYPLSYELENGSTVESGWALDIEMNNEEKLTVELKNYASSNSQEPFDSYMDITELDGRLYFKLPVTLDINSSTELFENVMVTMRAKKVSSANDYKFESFGYWATSDSADYSIEDPIFTEYETTDTKPYENISDYLSVNDFTDNLPTDYTKTYYIVNKYDQSNLYEVTETVVHDAHTTNPYPYNGTFSNLDSGIGSTLNSNAINDYVYRILRNNYSTISVVDDRGDLISSDIMGADLISGLKNDFKRGFNNIFYGINNYTFNYTLDNLTDQQKLDFLRNSLVGFDSLNKLLNSFLRYNFISTNDHTYVIDNNFRMGFFTRKPSVKVNNNKVFKNWLDAVPSSEVIAANLNTLQKIKNYEDHSSDDDIENRAKIEWIKDHLLYNTGKSSSTQYKARSPRNVKTKNVNNREMVNQTFDMLMDQRYNATKVINSFGKTNISKIILVDTKDKELFSGSQESVRFINSNQSIDVMIKSYLDGFNRKVGG